jgi:hypothetical protein
MLVSADRIGYLRTADSQLLAGAAYATPKGGVVMTKEQWIGFENLKFSINVRDGRHELVRL